MSMLIEWLAASSDILGWSRRYGAAMPVIPLIGAGLASLAQWILLPPVTIWFVRRQLA